MILTESLTDIHRWQAVLERDPSFDASFVYGVRSTGIYCRPSCPSRRPAQRRVAFYPSPQAAEAAGFRPCKRCRPHQPGDTGLQRARAVSRYLEENFEQPITLRALAERFGTSPAHLQRSFKAHLGVTPRQYQEHCRLRALRGALQNGEDISQATYGVGYGSSSRLYSRSDASLGMTPGTYRQKGKRMHIRYSSAATPFGPLLVAATERGICAVALGDDAQALERDLRAQFSQATLERADEALKPYLSAVLEHLAGQRPHLALPRDVQATAFQSQVWQALQEIPYGETRSYQEVASRIGKPEAVRAVAGACASNPTALVVPCHRVLRKGGALGGYRWGEARKQRLLEHEREHAGG